MKVKGPVLGFAILLVLPFITTAPRATAGTSEHATHPHTHKRYAQVKNPVPLSDQSIQAGKAIFEKNCTACHGKDGKGGTGPDLTDEQWIHGPSDGEIFHVISDGVAGTSMKGFENELSEEMRWHLVNYIRSLGKGKQTNQ